MLLFTFFKRTLRTTRYSDNAFCDWLIIKLDVLLYNSLYVPRFLEVIL